VFLIMQWFRAMVQGRFSSQNLDACAAMINPRGTAILLHK